ncbi:hypothetical protein LUZ61_021710 [Rhynchospora tenuis]|uniref:Uncharacterized protein n=1 Tax=Rhynchospora tenuis TaxID=198213 RepID=A0AAD5W7K7_9POAL|nr:hypothetical protein LUZ61_021710 [Rhynchospora tenuis]
MCKCRSHGTFLLFGLQSSHLNICYYLRTDGRSARARAPGFAAAAAPSYSSGQGAAPMAGCGSRASAPSIFGAS